MSAILQILLLLKRIFSKVDGRKPFQVLNAVVILSGALLYWMQKGELLMTANYLAARFCPFSGNACSWGELPEDVTELPEGVTEAEIAFFAEIVDEIDDPWLKAHLAHLVWHYQRPRNIKFALDAIDNYRSILLDAKTWVWAYDFWDRAIGLAISIKNSDHLLAIEDDIIQKFESATCEGRYFGRELVNLLRLNKLGKSRATEIATNSNQWLSALNLTMSIQSQQIITKLLRTGLNQQTIGLSSLK